MKKTMIEIETPDKLEEIVRQMGGSLTGVSRRLGYCDPFLKQALTRKRIAKHAFIALANELGITQEKLMEYIGEQKPEEPPKEEPKDNEVLNMLTLIYEMEKRQVEALQRLNGMFERTWCK